MAGLTWNETCWRGVLALATFTSLGCGGGAWQGFLAALFVCDAAWRVCLLQVVSAHPP